MKKSFKRYYNFSLDYIDKSRWDSIVNILKKKIRRGERWKDHEILAAGANRVLFMKKAETLPVWTLQNLTHFESYCKTTSLFSG